MEARFSLLFGKVAITIPSGPLPATRRVSGKHQAEAHALSGGGSLALCVTP